MENIPRHYFTDEIEIPKGATKIIVTYDENTSPFEVAFDND